MVEIKERLKRFKLWCGEDLLNQFRIELEEIKKETQKELLEELEYQFDALNDKSKFSEIIKMKLEESDN